VADDVIDVDVATSEAADEEGVDDCGLLLVNPKTTATAAARARLTIDAMRARRR
jgi:hypothetical protein